MPFPTTGLLDDFNRANEGPPPSASWTTAVIAGGTDGLVVLSNVLKGNGSGSNEGYWNVSTFGPDVECYMKVAAKLEDSGAYQMVYCRLTTIGSGTTDGYGCRLSFSATTDSLRLFRIDNGSVTYLGTGVSQETAVGDQWGIEIVGDALKLMYKPVAGSWSSIESVTDGTYSASGHIGALLRGGNTHRADDFSGGTVVSSPLATRAGLIRIGP